MTDLFKRRRRTHLSPVGGRSPVAPPPAPAGESLEFALMWARKSFEQGRHQAAVVALVDALWIQHTGRHEQVSDERMHVLLRGIVGEKWLPPEAA